MLLSSIKQVSCLSIFTTVRYCVAALVSVASLLSKLKIVAKRMRCYTISPVHSCVFCMCMAAFAYACKFREHSSEEEENEEEGDRSISTTIHVEV